ncbi:MAG: hypothetical protein RMY34_21155 [Aulosira sp. DedQUE10]|nr:hypothetical protein [Aulosira sp. DedQUE10]
MDTVSCQLLFRLMLTNNKLPITNYQIRILNQFFSLWGTTSASARKSEVGETRLIASVLKSQKA